MCVFKTRKESWRVCAEHDDVMYGERSTSTGFGQSDCIYLQKGSREYVEQNNISIIIMIEVNSSIYSVLDIMYRLSNTFFY